MPRQRRERRNPFDEGQGRRRHSENEEEEEGDRDIAFAFVVFGCFCFCIFWHGRGQRLCRGSWRRLGSDFFIVFVVDISSVAVDEVGALVGALVGPLAPGIQAQAREG